MGLSSSWCTRMTRCSRVCTWVLLCNHIHVMLALGRQAWQQMRALLEEFMQCLGACFHTRLLSAATSLWVFAAAACWQSKRVSAWQHLGSRILSTFLTEQETEYSPYTTHMCLSLGCDVHPRTCGSIKNADPCRGQATQSQELEQAGPQDCVLPFSYRAGRLADPGGWSTLQAC